MNTEHPNSRFPKVGKLGLTLLLGDSRQSCCKMNTEVEYGQRIHLLSLHN